MANTNKRGEQFTIYVPPDLLKLLKARAIREHRSTNAHIVWLIEQDVKNSKKQQEKQ